MKAGLLLGLAAALAAGCTSVPERDDRVDRRARIYAALQDAAGQVRRCYRAPRVSREARQIVTQLRVRVAPDGQLAEPPELLGQIGVTPATRPYAVPMAEAAIAAVMRCAPLRLPPAAFAEGWNEFDLTFRPLISV